MIIDSVYLVEKQTDQNLGQWRVMDLVLYLILSLVFKEGVEYASLEDAVPEEFHLKYICE